MKMDEKDDLILEFAEIVHTINGTHSYLDDFILKNKVSTGRDFRRQLRITRDLCKSLLKSSLEWERQVRKNRKQDDTQ